MSGNVDVIGDLGLGFSIFIYALMYKYGYFRGKQNNRLRKIINMDDVIFGGVDEMLAKKADTICFWICTLMACLVAANGILIATLKIFNISMILVLTAFPGAAIFRLAFIYFKRSARS